MTISFVGHQRETRPRLRNHHGNSSDDPKSDAALQYVTKIDKALPLQSPIKHLYHNTYYSISSCMGGMLFCNTRTVTWLAATSTNEIAAADVSGQNGGVLDKKRKQSHWCHNVKKLPQWCWVKKQYRLRCALLDRWDCYKYVDKWHALGTMIYSLKKHKKLLKHSMVLSTFIIYRYDSMAVLI